MRKDEGGSSGSGDGLCMIDPLVLRGVINDLAAMEAAIGTETKGLKAEFAKVGAGANALTELTKVAAWLHAELPMLRRRQAAAALLASQRMQCVPGTNLIEMPEDFTFAAQQAGELAVKQVRAGLAAKPPTTEASLAAAAALKQITGRRGRLTSEDLAFLEAFYGGLGRTVYQVPGQLGDDKAGKGALAAGLLMLSNEKLGGGFDKVPTEIRQDLRDNAWSYWNVPGDRTGDPGKGFSELAAFLQNRDDKSTPAPGKDFAVGIALSIADELRMKVWIQDEYNKVFPKQPHGMGKNRYLSKADGQSLLSLVATNHDASAELMGNGQFVRVVVGENWDDQGVAVGRLTDWAAKAASDPSSPEYDLAKKATADLINVVTTNAEDQDHPHGKIFKETLEGLKENPMIARAFSRLIATNIADFGGDEPNSAMATGADGNLEVPTDRRNRFTMLASMDPQGRTMLRIAAEAYKLTVFTSPQLDREAANEVAAIDGIIAAAAHNALYYDKVADADGQNQAREAARADDAARLAVLRQFYDTLAGTLPGGTSIGLAKTALNQLLDTGLKLPEPTPVLPGKIPADADASGVLIPESRAAHDFAQAHLRADGNGGTAGLQSALFKRATDRHQQLRELSEMSGTQRKTLRDWAEANGGERYVSTYAGLFARTYADSEKVDDGQAVMKDFVNSPS